MNMHANIIMAISLGLSLSSHVYADQPERPSFDEIDVNADGEIDFDEFSLQELPNNDDPQTIFDNIDTNGDGIASQEEFDNHKPAKPARPSFDSVDADINGEIDFEEFSLLELPQGDYQTIFDDIDTDDDAIISEYEYNNHHPTQTR